MIEQPQGRSARVAGHLDKRIQQHGRPQTNNDQQRPEEAG
jgi:hypothetical protein